MNEMAIGVIASYTHCIGFALTGIKEVYEVDPESITLTELEEIINNAHCSILIVEEQIAKLCEQMKTDKELIIIPQADSDSIQEMITKAIGASI
ncbi:MAG: vacuolar-type H+-ATPase subunit F/Vma7 [Candidatus Woesearchaeota archaeon]|jgi:vacuolar-type H+-ATPase subunit F/Vma7